MHKFNLEIEIPDKDYCRGCPVKRTFLMCEMGYELPKLIDDKGIVRQPRPDICKQNDKPIQEFIKQDPTNWDDLSYNQKEELRKRNPELWRKLYKQKYGSGN